MLFIRVFSVVFVLALIGYTAVTISNHGWNLFPYFFGDMLAMNWAGQFNFDFMGFLMLSALWTMWRNQFTGAGIALGVVAFFGGMLFLCLYLIYLSFQESTIESILTGNNGDSLPIV